jgi:hypothetical protein
MLSSLDDSVGFSKLYEATRKEGRIIEAARWDTAGASSLISHGQQSAKNDLTRGRRRMRAPVCSHRTPTVR